MNLIEDTKLNIKRLEEDSAFNVLSALVDEETNFNDLRDRLRNIRSEIDNSARKLAIWHGRKTRIKEADLTNLANEVAVTSEDVRLKKEEFEQASWNYLKEAEVLRYMPADLEQRKKVDELIAIRNQKIENMAQAVNQAIESEISEAENLMTEHILEKERLQDEVDITDNRIEFLRILLDGSDELKEKKRNELEGTLLSLNSELKELEKLFPAAAASAQEENDSADLSEVEVTAEIADAESQ